MDTTQVRQSEGGRVDMLLTASPVGSLLLRDGSILAASTAPWQPSAHTELLRRVRSLRLWSLDVTVLDGLAHVIDQIASGMYMAGGHPDRPILEAVAAKLRGTARVRRYRETDAYRRMSLCHLAALSQGAAAREEYGVTAAEESEYATMCALDEASAL